MRINPVSAMGFGVRNAVKGIIYIKPEKNGKTQEGIINSALAELSAVEFNQEDVSEMQAHGANLPFKNGAEAVEYLKAKNIPIQYGKFSDKNVHACLGRNEEGNATVYINKKYKNSTEKPEILETAVAIVHEAGHAKDNDNSNSIQEEIDNLALSVVVHRSLGAKNPGVFKTSSSKLVNQGGELYSDLFKAADKTALKTRIADKYGHMPAGDSKHPASPLATEIKQLDCVA